MKTYKRNFLEFAISRGVLKFGKYTLKSGRISPYFFNAGLFNTGGDLAKLGRFYAQAIIDANLDYDMMYGPAYKGIPLVAVTTMALADNHQRNIPYAFNRKEVKDHGEGGDIVGAPLSGKVLIIDDVISAGTSIRESVDMINHYKATASSVIIALNRQERGLGKMSAIQEVEMNHKLQVASIVTLDDLITFLSEQNDPHVESILAYRDQYGC